MAGPNYVLDKGFVAFNAITKFEPVVLRTDQAVQAVAAQGVRVIGICQEEVTTADAANGRVVDVRLMGISRAICGETINTVMTPLTTGADGRMEIALTGDFIIGYNLQTGVDGDHFDVLIAPQGTAVPA